MHRPHTLSKRKSSVARPIPARTERAVHARKVRSTTAALQLRVLHCSMQENRGKRATRGPDSRSAHLSGSGRPRLHTRGPTHRCGRSAAVIFHVARSSLARAYTRSPPQLHRVSRSAWQLAATPRSWAPGLLRAPLLFTRPPARLAGSIRICWFDGRDKCAENRPHECEKNGAAGRMVSYRRVGIAAARGLWTVYILKGTLHCRSTQRLPRWPGGYHRYRWCFALFIRVSNFRTARAWKEHSADTARATITADGEHER